MYSLANISFSFLMEVLFGNTKSPIVIGCGVSAFHNHRVMNAQPIIGLSPEKSDEIQSNRSHTRIGMLFQIESLCVSYFFIARLPVIQWSERESMKRLANTTSESVVIISPEN